MARLDLIRDAQRPKMHGRALFAGPTGSGKALRDDQLVLTPDGWVPVAVLEPGDTVYGVDGMPCPVTGVYPQGVRPLNEVVFSDGVVIVADDEHRWFTHTQRERHEGKPGSVRTTAEIADTLDDKHHVPMAAPAEHPDAELPVEPYVLGLLLGDGGMSRRGVTFSCPDAELVEALGKQFRLTSIKHDPIGWQVNGGPQALRPLGLLGKRSDEKFVPPAYMLGSPAQRHALVQGLLDTDGYGRGSTCEWTTTSETLAEQFVELVQSLGGTVTVSDRLPSYTYLGERRTGRRSWRCYVKLPAAVEPFRLARKALAYRPRSKYPPRRTIVAVRPTAPGLATCISVGAPDRLFVTAGHVPTHNTWTALSVARRIVGDEGSVLVIDTERESALTYADVFTFKHLPWRPPYDPSELTKTLDKLGSTFDVVIIDSMTHFWRGQGGILDIANGRVQGGWDKARPIQEALVEQILATPAHMLMCARMKKTVLVSDGGKTIESIGLTITQDDELEYEMNIVAQLDMHHQLTVTKALADDQRVLTPYGWTPIGQMQVGQVVCTPTGTAAVTDVFPQGERPMWEVITNDGASVLADADHLWSVHTKHSKTLREMSTAQIAEYLPHSVYLPTIEPVTGWVTDLTVDPYVLGALLGDGTLGGYTTSITSADPWIIEELERRGETVKKWGRQYKNAPAYGIVNMAERIRLLGLAGTRSHTKFIPERYLFAPPAQRLDLLRGLLDTDGCPLPQSAIAKYTSTSYELAAGVQYLARSLGWLARLRLEQPPTTYRHKGVVKTGKPNWIVNISVPNDAQPFGLPRKQERIGHRNKKLMRRIVEVRAAARSLCTCIRLDDPAGLFITEGCMVTHNSRTTAVPVGRLYPAGMENKLAADYDEWLAGGIPPANRDDVEAIVGVFAGISDREAMIRLKQDFVEAFGMPHALTAARVAEAKDWLAERGAPVGEGPAATARAEEPAETPQDAPGSTVAPSGEDGTAEPAPPATASERGVSEGRGPHHPACELDADHVGDCWASGGLEPPQEGRTDARADYVESGSPGFPPVPPTEPPAAPVPDRGAGHLPGCVLPADHPDECEVSRLEAAIVAVKPMRKQEVVAELAKRGRATNGNMDTLGARLAQAFVDDEAWTPSQVAMV